MRSLASISISISRARRCSSVSPSTRPYPPQSIIIFPICIATARRERGQIAAANLHVYSVPFFEDACVFGYQRSDDEKKRPAIEEEKGRKREREREERMWVVGGRGRREFFEAGDGEGKKVHDMQR